MGRPVCIVFHFMFSGSSVGEIFLLLSLSVNGTLRPVCLYSSGKYQVTVLYMYSYNTKLLRQPPSTDVITTALNMPEYGSNFSAPANGHVLPQGQKGHHPHSVKEKSDRPLSVNAAINSLMKTAACHY